MRHFILEFITGGGLAGQPLPRSLKREGEQMLRALVDDLRAAGHGDISIARDRRWPCRWADIRPRILTGPAGPALQACLADCDCGWLIAPETGNQLASLARLFQASGRLYPGCPAAAVRLAGGKADTLAALAGAAAPAIQSARLIDGQPPRSGAGWVAKPDDGAGGEGCRFIADQAGLAALRRDPRCRDFIIQPWLAGEPVSLSLLVYQSDFRVLGCNRQYMRDRFRLRAIGVNEYLPFLPDLEPIAKKIVTALPGLRGYIGVDLLHTADGFIVLEINPRFTTAYAGLSRSLGINVAEAILDTLLNKKLPDIPLHTATPVRIKV